MSLVLEKGKSESCALLHHVGLVQEPTQTVYDPDGKQNARALKKKHKSLDPRE